MPCPSLLVEVQTEAFRRASSQPALKTEERWEGRSPSPLLVQLCTSMPQGGSREPHHFGSNRNWKASPQPYRANGRLE